MSNSIKLAYILAHPLLERDFIRYGVKYMQDTGALSCVVDAFDVFYKGKNRNEIQRSINIVENIFFIKSLLHLENLLKAENINKIILIATPGTISFHKTVKCINNLEIPIATINVGSIPSFNNSKWYLKRLQTTFMNQKFSNNCKKLFEKTVLHLERHDASVDYVFYGGKKIKNLYPSLYLNAKNQVSVHSLDYDLYQQNQPKLTKDKYVVFIDQFIPEHPDRYLSKDTKYDVDKKIVNFYYQRLNYFFKEVEEIYKCRVIIAAHPRSDYTSTDKRFDGREIVHGSIAGLIKFSEFCVTYGSTAVNLAVLNHKAIAFISMDIFKYFINPVDRDLARAMSKELGSTHIKIDKKLAIDQKIDIDLELYNNYKENYIKESRSLNGFFWEIVFNTFLKDQ